MLKLEDLTHALQRRLAKDLPGIEAHRRVMPADRDPGPRYQFDRLKSPRQGGVLIMLYTDEQGIVRFPLMQRQDYGGVHSGQVSLPGGKMEKYDRDITETALRETEEETGVPAASISVIGSMSRLYIPPSNYLVTPVLGYVNEMPEFREDPREVKELFSVTIDDLLDEGLYRITDLNVRGQIFRNIPYFHLNEKVVWGATAMILSELAHIVREIS